MNQLVIRADTATDIGMGHVMRCIALGKAWKTLGGSVTFVTCSDNKSIRQRLESNDFSFVPLSARHPDPADLATSLDVLNSISDDEGAGSPPWLVTDGYFFSPSYHAAARSLGYRLLVIDDVADLPVYHADVVLNQNIGAEKYQYRHDDDTVLLLGTRYALIRPEFAGHSGGSVDTIQTASRLLVTMGGADPLNITLRVLHALRRTSVCPLEVTVVVGGDNPHHETLQKEIQSIDDSTSIVVRLETDVEDMAELMAWAEMAVSASGSTFWELASMGVPSILLVAAENQTGIASEVSRREAAVNLGWYDQVSSEDLAAAVNRLATDQKWRRRLRTKAGALVDGRGTERVARHLIFEETLQVRHDLTLRPAGAQDAIPLWTLANDPVVRSNSFSPDPISLEQHMEWYQDKLSSNSTVFWVLATPGSIAGQIRYDRRTDVMAEVGFSIVESFRGQGLGTMLLERTWELACDKLKVSEIQGRVKENNKGSARAFEKANFDEGPGDVVDGLICRTFLRKDLLKAI